jgi:hypothetical protein
MGDLSAPRHAYERALETQVRAGGVNQLAMAATLTDLGSLLRREGRLEQARSLRDCQSGWTSATVNTRPAYVARHKLRPNQHLTEPSSELLW